MDTSPVRTTNLGLRLEYTACAKRIKGESKNISGKVPENELEKLLTAEIAEDAENYASSRSFREIQVHARAEFLRENRATITRSLNVFSSVLSRIISGSGGRV
jgi:hypothetical protein